VGLGQHATELGPHPVPRQGRMAAELRRLREEAPGRGLQPKVEPRRKSPGAEDPCRVFYEREGMQDPDFLPPEVLAAPGGVEELPPRRGREAQGESVEGEPPPPETPPDRPRRDLGQRSGPEIPLTPCGRDVEASPPRQLDGRREEGRVFPHPPPQSCGQASS